MKTRNLAAWLVLAFVGSSCSAADLTAEQVAAAAKKAVAYFKQAQNDDGTFGKGQGAGMPGMVGLVVRALATSPEKLRESDPAVKKAAAFLLTKTQPNGSICEPKFGLENYNTSVAVIALAALENPAHKEALEKAKQYILGCQIAIEKGYDEEHPQPAFGGFDYGSSKRVDLSNTGFSIEALQALGVQKDSDAYKNAIKFIKRCQDNDETNDLPNMKGENNTGAFTYKPGESEFGTVKGKNGKMVPKPYGNMTYVAVKTLIYAGVNKDDPALQAALKWIRNNYAVDHPAGGEGMQGYYYYIDVFAKAFTALGTKEVDLPDGKKAQWASDLAAHLISLQKPDGSFANDAPRWMENDPILATSYALDAMNLCYNAMK